jgi:hypothetical protein
MSEIISTLRGQKAQLISFANLSVRVSRLVWAEAVALTSRWTFQSLSRPGTFGQTFPMSD